MHRSYPPSPILSNKSSNESSVEDYDDALLDVDGDMECTHEDTIQNFESIIHCINNERSRPSSVTTADWEEPESWMASAQNSESFPVSTPGSSSGASPLTGTSSQGVSPGINNNYEQAFPFSIPEGADQTSSISDVLQVEKDFMEYVMSFPLNVTNVPPQLLPAAPVASAKKTQGESNPKVGLDHLDNLCKLMEQLSDLKEANIKLKRRVQYLEDIKTLHEIHKEMVGERKLYSSGLSEDEVQQLKQKLDKSTERELSEDSLPDSMHLETPPPEQLYSLYRSKTTNQIVPLTEYKNERGHKSRSTTVNKERRERSKSVGHPSHGKAKKRPSRWSKVKEVLGIEKTDEFSTGGEGEKSDERDKIELERIDKDKESLSRKGSEKSKTSITSTRSHSNVLSSRSFSEAERPNTAAKLITAKKSGTLDSKTAQSVMENFEKEEMGQKKSPKTPWGKMKTMIQIRRDNRQPKSESSSSSPRDAKPGSKPSTSQVIDRRIQRSNHRTTFQDVGADPESEYEKNIQSGQFSDRSPRHLRLDNGISEPYRHRQKSPQKPGHRKSSVTQQDLDSKGKPEKEEEPLQRNKKTEKEEDSLQRNKVDDREAYYEGKDPTKENGKRKKSKPRPLPLEYVGDDNPLPCEDEDMCRSPGVSPLAHRKWMWTKVKGVLKGKREEDGPISLSVPSSPSSVADCLAFDFDLEKAKDEECLSSVYQTPRVPECSPCTSSILPNASPSTTVTELLRELQQNLSDDFNKKLEEWQRCRTEGIHKVPCPEVERKDSFGRMRKISKPEKKVSTADKLVKSNYHLQKKDLSWLEKEQQKVEREIVRLSKEKQKFEKRAFRLKQLKEAMTDGDGHKKEVLVKTSAGEFRFEGISDDFTKKLYEWETKKGVNPELSTIALLDESLKLPPETVISAACSASIGSNSTRPSPDPTKSCYQVSRASSEPDLSSTQKEVASNNQATQRSKSGDTLLAGETEIVPNLEGEKQTSTEQGSRDTILHGDDNYYSLLEENMYLLDQLKEKEEICSHLQNELDRLDDRTEKTNRTHQEEMEKYRQKLWEIHMSRPRDLQGSLHLISELKSRIEELQKCSDKLKSDRERLEDSFRYHSNQQARLADDLIRKVRDFQESGMPWGFNRGTGYRRKWRKLIKCDHNSMSRIHDLSTRLLQQARDVEQTLMERTRQVCHLRWELLHRDMSAVLLQAALHRVTSQGEPVTILPTWDKRRNRFKNIKAWSVDTTTRRPSEDLVTDDWLQERLRQLSMTPYNDWANIDFSPNDLMATAHELKKETLRLAISRPDRMSDSEDKKSATCSAESEIADSDRYYDTGSAVNSRSSSFSSGPGGLRGSHSDTRLYERSRALRRNSSSSMSCVEASDSSSIHDSDKVHFLVKKFPWRTQWRSLDNVSSSCSSRSSVLDDDITKTSWKPPKSSFRESLPQDETPHNHLQVKYGSFKEVDEETEELKAEPSPDWGSHCLITPTPIHLARISDTESDKNMHSPPPYLGKLRDVDYEISLSRSSKCIPGKLKPSVSGHKDKSHYSYDSTNFPIACRIMKNTCASGGYDTYGEQTTSYKSATEGSLESLDKYETAIRDEELTISDEKNSREVLSYNKGMGMKTFSDFEKDLKQRATKTLASSPNAGSVPHHSISDYIDREKQSIHLASSPGSEYNASSPGSPRNIAKFKYKGSKGFGRSPRVEYSRKDENDKQTDMHSQSSLNNCETVEETLQIDS